MLKLWTNAMVLAGVSLLGACSAGVATDDGVSEEALQSAPFFAGDPANHAVFAVDVSMWETPLAQSEMDCFWDSGVRHIVAGTQVEQITREQLAMAVARGMTVDAYVYLYWDTDVTAQIEEAFRRVSGFPIGRMWLDIEQDPAGRGANKLIPLIQQGVDACHAHGGVDCGIYTGPGFWKSYVNNTTTFSDVPIWYALYNYKTSLSNWSTEHFGGWTTPVAKQWATQPLCGVGGADKDVMQVLTTPTLVVDRTLPPDSKLPPSAPGGLFPANGDVVVPDYVKLMSTTVPRATQYQLALERWTGSAFLPYFTWANANAFVKVSPGTPNSVYRFRARAKNAYGWGAWSDYSTFDYGHPTGPRPSATPPAPAPGPSTPPPTPPTPGVPGALAPDGGAPLAGPEVTLTCSAVDAATDYEFAVESNGTSGFVPYYTYESATGARSLWPSLHTTYRWRVRSKVAGVFGGWSPYATFALN